MSMRLTATLMAVTACTAAGQEYRTVYETVKEWQTTIDMRPTSVTELQPRTSTQWRAVEVTRLRTVTETVEKPVTVTEYRECRRMVKREVCEPVMREVCRQICEPVTETKTVCRRVPVCGPRCSPLQVPDCGGCKQKEKPDGFCAKVHDCWQSFGDCLCRCGAKCGVKILEGGPLCQALFIRLPDRLAAGCQETMLVTEQVPVTRYVRRTVKECIPTTVRKTVTVPVVERVPVQVTKMVPQCVTRQVVERTTQCVPETVTKMVPVQVTKMMPTEVRTCVPKTVCRLIRVQTENCSACAACKRDRPLLDFLDRLRNRIGTKKNCGCGCAGK